MYYQCAPLKYSAFLKRSDKANCETKKLQPLSFANFLEIYFQGGNLQANTCVISPESRSTYHDDYHFFFQDKHYLCVMASDTPDQNLQQYFSLCNDFIHAARLRGGNVLIHWWASNLQYFKDFTLLITTQEERKGSETQGTQPDFIWVKLTVAKPDVAYVWRQTAAKAVSGFAKAQRGDGEARHNNKPTLGLDKVRL